MLWYKHTMAFKRADRKMEGGWEKTREFFHITWKESTNAYRQASKTARSAYFSTLL